MSARRRWLIPAVVVIAVVIATGVAMMRSGASPEPVIAPQRAAVPRPPGATVEITYIANEGVLIAAGDKQVSLFTNVTERLLWPRRH